MNEQKQKFITEYIANNFNGTVAAQKSGYSQTRARITASELLAQEEIQTELARLLSNDVMNRDVLLYKLSQIAQNRISDYMNDTGEIDLAQLRYDGLGWLVKGVKRTKQGNEIMFHDALKALEILAKAYNILNDKIDVNLNITKQLSAEELLNEKLELMKKRMSQEYQVAETSVINYQSG